MRRLDRAAQDENDRRVAGRPCIAGSALAARSEWPILVLVVICALCAPAAALADAVDVVSNGGFETPISGSMTTYAAGQAIGAWIVGFGDVQQIGDFWDAASGA